MNIVTDWEAPVIPTLDQAEKQLVRTSTSYFNDIKDPVNSPNDRKNMRINTSSLFVNEQNK